MRVLFVPDDAILCEETLPESLDELTRNILKGDGTTPKFLGELTRELLQGGVYDSSGARSSHDEEYKLSLSALLDIEYDKSLSALVVLQCNEGKLSLQGFTWLWILRGERVICSYTHFPRRGSHRIPAPSYLDVVCEGPLCNKVVWQQIFERDIADALLDRTKAA